ncbi:hypothetical protein LX36DRAFT_407082 [Colletotrichum falcatum]|nr:hypothetical protein LX36DRAFT_407082 [Colletotrichum falcatum]
MHPNSSLPTPTLGIRFLPSSYSRVSGHSLVKCRHAEARAAMTDKLGATLALMNNPTPTITTARAVFKMPYARSSGGRHAPPFPWLVPELVVARPTSSDCSHAATTHFFFTSHRYRVGNTSDLRPMKLTDASRKRPTGVVAVPLAGLSPRRFKPCIPAPDG